MTTICYPDKLLYNGLLSQAFHKANHLAQALAATLFIRDPCVRFTNNQAECDLSMVKLKQKIFGGFRTTQGAHHYARIRGYISTLGKQQCTILESLTQAFQLLDKQSK